MAKIYIKRLREPIVTDRKTASKVVLKRWGNERDHIKPYPPNSVISIGDFRGQLGDVVNVDLRTEVSRSDENKGYTENIEIDYMKYREKIYDSGHEARAHNMNFFKLIYQAFTNEIELPNNLILRAVEIQDDFFKENPKRIYCDPVLFKGLFEKGKSHSPMLRVIESLVQQDMYHAKRGL